jgi:hypothetical protein
MCSSFEPPNRESEQPPLELLCVHCKHPVDAHSKPYGLPHDNKLCELDGCNCPGFRAAKCSPFWGCPFCAELERRTLTVTNATAEPLQVDVTERGVIRDGKPVMTEVRLAVGRPREP